MNKTELQLIRKYITGKASDIEIQKVLKIIKSKPHLKEIIEPQFNIENISEEYKKYQYFKTHIDNSILFRIEKKIRKKNIITTILKITSAAAVISLFLITSILLIKNHNIKDVVNESNDVLPGAFGASITLYDGRVLNLDNQGDTIIKDILDEVDIKITDNCIQLNSGKKSSLEKLFGKKEVFQTIKTGTKQEFSVLLPDNTKVWLNSETTLKYSVNNYNTNRKVELTGEAFFDVKKNKKNPFVVTGKKQNIVVTGTMFSITSYPENKEVSTILLSGGIEIYTNDFKKKTVLVPNQQAVLSGNEFKVKNVNAQLLTSWRFNSFAFDFESLGMVTKKLSKWYGVKFHFKDTDIVDYHFTGVLPKYENISKSLELLELTAGIKFTIEENNNISVEKTK